MKKILWLQIPIIAIFTFAFVVVDLRGVDPDDMNTPMVFSFLSLLLAALLITWLLMQTSGLSYIRQVMFVTAIGLSAGVMVHLPYWNWWKFPLCYTIVSIFDLVIAWFLAGLVMAKMCQRWCKAA